MFQGALLLNPQNLLYFLSTPTSKQVKRRLNFWTQWWDGSGFLVRNKLQQYQGIDCLYSKFLIFLKGNYLWTTAYIWSWHKRFVGFMEQCTCRDSIERATHPDCRNGQNCSSNSEAQSFYKAVFGQKSKRG